MPAASPSPPTKFQRLVRGALEVVIGLAFLLAILYWPNTRAGQILLVACITVALIGLFVLRNWP